MKNKLIDLNNHLFAQLERLSDEGLDREKLNEEIKRGKAISDLGKVVVENAKLALDSEKFKAEFGARPLPQMPEMLVNNKAE